MADLNRKRLGWGWGYFIVGIAVLGSLAWCYWPTFQSNFNYLYVLWCVAWSAIGIGAGLINTSNYKNGPKTRHWHYVSYCAFALVLVSLVALWSGLSVDDAASLNDVGARFYVFSALVGLGLGFLEDRLYEWLNGQLIQHPKPAATSAEGKARSWDWNSVSAIAAAIALFLVWHQNARLTQSIELQTKTLELENRPYLYVNIAPRVAEHLEGKSWELYLGADLHYRNVGGIPASNIQSEIHIYNNAVKTDDFERYKEWFVTQHGYFPEITTVFPGQEVYPFHASAVDTTGGNASEYVVTLRVSYTGDDPSYRYWYSSDMRFKIDRDSCAMQDPDSKRCSVWLLTHQTDYDGVRHREMPPALSNPYLVKLQQSQ